MTVGLYLLLSYAPLFLGNMIFFFLQMVTSINDINDITREGAFYAGVLIALPFAFYVKALEVNLLLLNVPYK